MHRPELAVKSRHDNEKIIDKLAPTTQSGRSRCRAPGRQSTQNPQNTQSIGCTQNSKIAEAAEIFHATESARSTEAPTA